MDNMEVAKYRTSGMMAQTKDTTALAGLFFGRAFACDFVDKVFDSFEYLMVWLTATINEQRQTRVEMIIGQP